MEPQNQMRVYNILPDLCFQYFWRFSRVDGVWDTLPCPQALVYCNQWYKSVYKLFLLD